MDFVKGATINFCEICGTSYQVCMHHIRTKASGGLDIKENLMALCFNHHTETHNIGLTRFIEKYPRVSIILKEKGWKIDEGSNKWFLNMDWINET